MRTDDLRTLSIDHQNQVRRRINKLWWLSQRYGDTAKYQGFNQVEVSACIIKEVMALALLIMAEID